MWEKFTASKDEEFKALKNEAIYLPQILLDYTRHYKNYFIIVFP
jgi:hypothetical protein